MGAGWEIHLFGRLRTSNISEAAIGEERRKREDGKGKTEKGRRKREDGKGKTGVVIRKAGKP
jgi:hypothetical protein